MSDGNEPAVLEYRVRLMEGAIKDIGAALTGINQTLQALATLEIRHTEIREALTRAFDAIKEAKDEAKRVDERVDLIEKALPLMQDTTKWVRVGVIAVVGMVGTAVIKFVLTI